MAETIQAPGGMPPGTAVAAYPAHEAEPYTRRGQKPGGTPWATGTVNASREVSLDLPRGALELPVTTFVLHATVNGEEKFMVFSRGDPNAHLRLSERNRRQRAAYHGG